MTKTFTYNQQKYEYEIVRYRGSRIFIKVKEHGEIQVKVGYGSSIEKAVQFVDEKAQWIVNQLEYIKEYVGEYMHTYAEGDQFFYRGELYPVVFEQMKSNTTIYVERLSDHFLIRGSDLAPENVKKAMEKWYIKNARIRFQNRCQYYAPQLQVTYRRIAIKNQKRCWGSCSSKENLNFNWKLLMAPDEVLDYVVVHELCHLLELNHSPRFWKYVASIMPDYKVKEAWLKEYGNTKLFW